MKKFIKLAIYDTGFGLSVGPEITDEDGEVQAEVFTPEVLATRFFKVYLPSQKLTMDEWDREWTIQKNILQDMVDAYNEKFGGK